MLHAGVFYLLLSANEYRSSTKNAHLNSIKTCDCSRVEMDARDFLWGFFFTSVKWYVCSKLQLELTNRNFMGIMWDSAWHVIIMENSNSYFKTILRGPTLTRSMDLLGRKVSLKFKGNFTSSSTVFNQVIRNFFHLLLNQFLLTFWLFVCVHA